jgi:hypothetical protein
MAEMDGAIGDEQNMPYTMPVIMNATYLGDGINNSQAIEGDGSQGLIFRDNSGGTYANSIFGDFKGQPGAPALTIEDVSDPASQDSRARLEAGDLKLINNFWFDFAAGNTIEALIPQAFVRQALGANLSGNQITNNPLRSIGREQNAQLDPRPYIGSPAIGGADMSVYQNDPWFTPVNHVGAFGTYNWMIGWTALSELGYINKAATPTSIEEELRDTSLPVQIRLEQNYPNPFNPTTTISYTLDTAQPVRLAVYDVTGRLLAVLVDGQQAAGVTQVRFNGSNLASGIYIYRLETPSVTISRRMTLIK